MRVFVYCSVRIALFAILPGLLITSSQIAVAKYQICRIRGDHALRIALNDPVHNKVFVGEETLPETETIVHSVKIPGRGADGTMIDGVTKGGDFYTDGNSTPTVMVVPEGLITTNDALNVGGGIFSRGTKTINNSSISRSHF